MLIFDTEAGGRTLFVETYRGTLPLYPNWEDQPRAFREDMCRKALAVAVATVLDTDDVSPDVAPDQQDPRAKRPASDA